MSLSTKILIGLVTGVACGLFFGELVGFLRIVGDAFVMLLQMSVLPYVLFSLVAGLGSLDMARARELARTTGMVLLVTWFISLLFVALFPLALPRWESAAFFSSTLVEPAPAFDFLSLYIPANPFRSLAEAIVPAVVLFSVALGLALMSMDGKDSIVRSLNTLAAAMEKITGFVIRLSPYGVFAIAANAAGTMQITELRNLVVYGLIYMVFALILGFWLLPALVKMLTGLRYGQVIGMTRDALITAFATGNLFVVMPIIAQHAREMLVANDMDEDGSADLVNVVVPIAFNLPSAGKILTLSFIIFAGWMTGSALTYAQIPSLLSTGFLAFFGSTMTAVPFLLDLFRLPADAMQFFVLADNIIGNRFGVLVAAVHLLAIALIAGAAGAGRLRGTRRQWLRFGVTAVAIMFAAIVGLRATFALMPGEYEEYDRFMQMPMLHDTVEVSTLDEPPADAAQVKASGDVLERIRERGVLRVGYQRDELPFAFRNATSDMVGFDIEMAHELAGQLKVDLQLVRVESDQAVALLNNGYLDIVMSGVFVTLQLQQLVDLTDPYLLLTLALIVEDHRREEFSSAEDLVAQENLRLAVLDIPHFLLLAREHLPDAEILVQETPRDFLRGNVPEADALLLTAEAGSAWTIVYPSYSVTVPDARLINAPIAYAVGKHNAEWLAYLNTWIELRRNDRTIDRLFKHWFEGGLDDNTAPRWSIIRNVLGWVD
jgi:Na+/H+-dicarboxylate symporter/ABC-type amino acid transport substrate-binding protein